MAVLLLNYMGVSSAGLWSQLPGTVDVEAALILQARRGRMSLFFFLIFSQGWLEKEKWANQSLFSQEGA